ncbi:MAG: hypothetical protein AAF871_01600 [Pseudomonadota bacterium]
MVKAVLVLLATLAFSAGAYLVTFTGFAPEQFPVPQVNPPVQPAGYAFAIWGVIFLWLLASAAFGVLRRAHDPVWDATRWPLFVSFVIGAGWNTVALQSPVWATVMIWAMLVTALLGLFAAEKSDRPWLAWPIGLYAGWLTAASSVAIGLLLAGYGILGEIPAAVMAILLAVGLAAIFLSRTGNPAYGAAAAWALIGVMVQNLGSDTLLVVAGALGILALAAALWSGRRSLA